MSIKRCLEIHILDVGATKFLALGMLIMLFHMILDETIFAILVLSSYG
jgi:hypothetical protein